MRKSLSMPIGFALALLLLGPLQAQEKTVHISTLNWPPYTSDDLPRGGATTEVVRQAFEQAGYQVDVSYRPWKRAIDMAKDGKAGVIAYFPGYHCHHQEGFVASEPIGDGPLGFAEHVDAPITWDSLDSIGEQQLKIGTVLGYANTDEFDQKVGTGWIIAIPSRDDITNLKKLMRQRIDAVVIDKFVLEYLKATEPSLKTARDELRFDERPLEEKTLYLCFRDNEAGHAMMREFNAGLEKIDPGKIADEYFASAFAG